MRAGCINLFYKLPGNQSLLQRHGKDYPQEEQKIACKSRDDVKAVFKHTVYRTAGYLLRTGLSPAANPAMRFYS